MTMMLVHNFMHADCHAGNLLVRGIDLYTYPNMEPPSWWDKVKRSLGLVSKHGEGQPELVVLDAGLVTEMSPRGRRSLHRLLYDVFTGNGEGMSTAFSLSSSSHNL